MARENAAGQTFQAWFEKTRATPPTKRASEPFQHQIFVAESVGGARLICDAGERKRLGDAEAARRWDFFHRADRALLDALDADAFAAYGAKKAAFSRLKLIGAASVGAAAIVGLAVGALASVEAGGAAFLAIVIALGVVMGVLLSNGERGDERFEAAQQFRAKVLKALDEIEQARPSAEDMRALHDRLLSEATAEIQAAEGGAAPILIAGWAAARPTAEEPPEISRSIPRWRVAARRGALFAVNEHLLVLARGGRLSLRRVLVDLVAGRAAVLEARELRVDTAELWSRSRSDAVGPLGLEPPDALDAAMFAGAPAATPSEPKPSEPKPSEPKPSEPKKTSEPKPEKQPAQDAPAQAKDDASAKKPAAPAPKPAGAPPPPVAAPTAAKPAPDKPAPDKPTAPIAPTLARREIVIASPAGQSGVPAADSMLFESLAAADRVEQSRLRRAIAKLDAAAGADKSKAATLRRDLLKTALQARLDAIDVDLADFEIARKRSAEADGFEQLRAALFGG
ncbi:MAG: hypothetical protein AAFW46_10305 [Pseudomonadota bacterium]